MRNRFVTSAHRFFAALAAAHRAGAAIDANRRPTARDLGTLGIDASAYRDIR